MTKSETIFYNIIRIIAYYYLNIATVGYAILTSARDLKGPITVESAGVEDLILWTLTLGSGDRFVECVTLKVGRAVVWICHVDVAATRRANVCTQRHIPMSHKHICLSFSCLWSLMALLFTSYCH